MWVLLSLFRKGEAGAQATSSFFLAQTFLRPEELGTLYRNTSIMSAYCLGSYFLSNL